MNLFIFCSYIKHFFFSKAIGSSNCILSGNPIWLGTYSVVCIVYDHQIILENTLCTKNNRNVDGKPTYIPTNRKS